MKVLMFCAVLLVVLLICEDALGAAHKCPACRGRMYYAGKLKVEWGRMFCLYRCAMGHLYWFKRGSSSQPRTRSLILRCPVCRFSVTWTGKSYVQHGRTFKVYRCPNGHVCVGRR